MPFSFAVFEWTRAATPPEQASLLLSSGPAHKSYRNAASKDGIDQ
jgi:hypothetical protein